MIRSIAMSRATLMSLPTTGTQWNRLVTMANNSYSFSPLENSPQASGNVLAGALVGVRTNNTTLLNRVNQALDRFQSYATSAWQHAAFNRKAVGFVQAGEVVGRDTTAWRNALMAHLTGRHSGGGGGSDYHEILENGALRLSNNHGRAAFQTYTAIIAALNLTDRVQDVCASAKAWLGGTHSENGGWAMQATNRPTGRVMGWEGNDPAAASWYVSGRISGINPDDPLGSDRRAGAVPGDIHRDGGNFPNPGAAGLNQYVWGALFRQAAGMVSLHGMGCTGLFSYADNAVLRARQWMDRYAPDPTNFHAHGDTLLEYVYGREFSSAGGTVTAVGESVTIAAGWLGQSGTWLR